MSRQLSDAVAETNTRYVGDLPTLPPAMTGEDVPLYLAWRARPAIVAREAFFNVRVGPERADLGRDSELGARIQAAVSALRIDMLLSTGAAWWILEFHGHAGLSQLGRVLCYPELLRRTYQVDVPVRSALVSYTLNPFLEPCFTDRGLPVFIYDSRRPEPRLLNPDALTVAHLP